nr:hypothetical protein GCM10020092_012110 [Actinoplanes digitatis]
MCVARPGGQLSRDQSAVDGVGHGQRRGLAAGAVGEDRDDVRVRGEHGVVGVRPEPQRLAPVLVEEVGDVDLGDDRVGDGVQDLGLRREVVVERGPGDAQLGGEPPDRDRVEPLGVDQGARHLDDPLAGEQRVPGPGHLTLLKLWTAQNLHR